MSKTRDRQRPRFGRALHRHLPDSQRGVALLTVMFIMALMMMLAAYMVEEQHLTIRRAQNSLQSEFAFQAALAGEQLAIAALRDDLNQDILEDGPDKPVNDHLKEDWVKFEKPSFPIDLELTQIAGKGSKNEPVLTIKIIDESAKLNLNNMFKPANPALDADGKPVDPWADFWILGFKGLLQSLDLDPGLSQSVEQWLDPDDQTDSLGEFAVEDGEYLLEDPPYRAANRLIDDLSELALLKGFDEEVIEKLKPYVTALPSYGATVNFNTCEPELLQMAFVAPPGATTETLEYMTVDQAETLFTELDRESGDGAVSFNDEFATKMPPGTWDQILAFYGQNSTYFRVISQVKVGEISYGVDSLVKRINLNDIGPDDSDELIKLKEISTSAGTDRAYVKVIQRRRTIS